MSGFPRFVPPGHRSHWAARVEGYYAWLVRPPSARQRSDEALSIEIKRIHDETRQVYGSPRIHAELHDEGMRVGRNRVQEQQGPGVRESSSHGHGFSCR